MKADEDAARGLLSEAALDEALRSWSMAPLPTGFAAATLQRVRGAPRFRLAVGDVAAALLAALAVVLVSAVVGAVWIGTVRPAGSEAGLAVARWWLNVRPVDARLASTVSAAVALAVAAVGVGGAVVRSPRAWAARRG